jgi:hypothetical protein
VLLLAVVVVVAPPRSCAWYFDKAAKPVLRGIICSRCSFTAAALGLALGGASVALAVAAVTQSRSSLLFGTRRLGRWFLFVLSGNLLAFIFLIDSSYLVLGKF